MAFDTWDISADDICDKMDHYKFKVTGKFRYKGKQSGIGRRKGYIKFQAFCWRFLTFLLQVDHPQANGDIPIEGIPSAIEQKNPR